MLPTLTLQECESLLSDKYFRAAVERSRVADYPDFIRRLYLDLDEIAYGLQKNPQYHYSKSEDQLSDEFIRALNLQGYIASHDQSSGGHVDLTVFSGNRSFSWIGEAKIYRQISDLDEGFLQLMTRYKPASGDYKHNSYGMVIYIMRSNIVSLIDEWRARLKTNFSCYQNDFDDSNNTFAFNSQHKHQSDLIMNIRHLSVYLHFSPQDKSARSSKSKKASY